MAIYKVFYGSMTATYGPSFIEADSPEQAKRRFGSCFSDGERAVCMTAREVSAREIQQALYDKEHKED
jgi:hypothetical protein